LVRLKVIVKKEAKILGRLAREVLTTANQIKASYNQTIPKQIADATEDVEMQPAEDLNNFCELSVEGVFIKHDFEHIIVKPDEVPKYTKGDLSLSTLKQCLYVPYEFDI